MSRASENELSLLHKLLAEEFAKMLTEGVRFTDSETGEVITRPPTAAELNTIRQFLKDNNIQAAMDHSPALKDIVADLPSFEGSPSLVREMRLVK
jgi:hypothetical protein